MKAYAPLSLLNNEEEGSWDSSTRLRDLSSSGVDHTCLWRLNPRRGPILHPDAFVDAVRFGLGCAGSTERTVCAACDTGLLGTGAKHASCCALSEGHAWSQPVVQIIQEAAHSCDTSAATEVSGLAAGTELHPADVRTSAIGNLSALDVLICSPRAQEAGLDCTQTTVANKLAYYGPHQNTLHAPMSGHLPTLTVLRTLSKCITHRRNVATEQAVFQRLHERITVEIWRAHVQADTVLLAHGRTAP